MLVDKERIKKRMVEYISDEYWIKDKKPTFTDIYNRFKIHISRGSTNNYIEELIKEKKIVKEKNGGNVYYARPSMQLSTKLIISCGLFTIVLIALIQFNPIFINIFFFNAGVFFASFLWRVFGVKSYE